SDHRALSSFPTRRSSDLTDFPEMPSTRDYPILDQESNKLPKPEAPEHPSPLFQEKGIRYSRALPYQLDTLMNQRDRQLEIHFERSEEHTSELQSRENLVC